MTLLSRKSQKPMKRTRMKRGKAGIVRRRRTKKEFARIYGSKARVEFVKSLPCAACGVVGYSENAHLLGNAGMSRKGGYTEIGPLCGPHRTHPASFSVSCHRDYDEAAWAFHIAFPDFDPAKVAADTEARWQEFQEKGE